MSVTYVRAVQIEVVDGTDSRRGGEAPRELDDALIEDAILRMERTPNEEGVIISPFAGMLIDFWKWCDEREDALFRQYGWWPRPIKTRKTPAGLWKQFQVERKAST